MRLFFILISFVASVFLFAQDNEFIITISGDTLFGDVKDRDNFNNYPGQITLISKDNSKQKFKESEIVGYFNGEYFYESIDLSGKKKSYQIMRKLVEGQLTLYTYEIVVDPMSVANTLKWNERGSYWVFDQKNMKWKTIPSVFLKKMLIFYVKDHKELSESLLKRDITYEDVPEIITEYNTWFFNLKSK